MIEKKKIVTLSIVVVLILIGIILNFRDNTVEVLDNDTNTNDVIASSPAILKVDIKGAVANPGVFEVREGDRVFNVIEMAGGLLEDANTQFINLGKRVFDEMTIWIYTDQEVEDLKPTIIQWMDLECDCPSVENSACISTPGEDGLININAASLDLLMTLPGIGESRARAIIDYRIRTPFRTIEDIMNVSGIGESLFGSIKELITV